MSVLDRGLKLVSYKAAKLAGKLLRHVLIAMVDTYPVDLRALSAVEYEKHAGDPAALFDLRGKLYDPGEPSEVGIRWHVPSPEEIAFAEELMARYYTPAVKHLVSLPSSGTAPTVSAVAKLRLRGALLVLRNASRIGLPLFPEDPSGDVSEPGTGGKFPRCSIRIGAEVVESAAYHRRTELCRVVKAASSYILSHREDDTKSLRTLIKIIFQLVASRGIKEQKYEKCNRMTM